MCIKEVRVIQDIELESFKKIYFYKFIDMSLIKVIKYEFYFIKMLYFGCL